MKKLVVTISLILICSSVAAKGDLKMVYFDNFQPYSWWENGQMRGIIIDVINAVVRDKMGVQVTHSGYPWKRAQMMVQFNKADAFVTVPTSKRKEYTKISTEPVLQITVTLFTNKLNKRVEELKAVKDISDLKEFSIVSYIGNGWVEQNLQNMKVKSVPTLDRAHMLLANNRYDLYIGATQVVWYNIKRLKYESNIMEIPTVLDSTSLNLCIGKDSPFITILPEFNKVMKRMNETGELKAVYNKYK